MDPRTAGPIPGPPAGRALARLARAVLTVTAALVTTACGTTSAAPPEVVPPSERAAATMLPALVRITGTFVGWVHDQAGSYANNGRSFTYTTTCTGFGVHPDGYVATAGHCVDTIGAGGVREPFIRAAAEELVAARPDLRLDDVIAHGRSTWTVQGRTAGSPVESDVRISGIPGAPPDGMPARVVEARPLMAGDVALLKVETTNLPSLELTTGTDVPVGTPLLAGGYPATVGRLVGPDAQPSIKDGAVNGTRTVGSGSGYEISAALAGGMSGGPTVDHTGRVLGVISLRGTDAQPVNLAVPASGIAELLGRNGTRNELGPRDLLYRKALDAYHTGEHTDAIDALDHLLREVPAHPQASELRTAAESAREQHGDASENHISRIVTCVSLGIGVALGILVGGLLVGRRRRRKPAPVPPAAHPRQWGGPGAPFAAPAPPIPHQPGAPTVPIRVAGRARGPRAR